MPVSTGALSSCRGLKSIILFLYKLSSLRLDSIHFLSALTLMMLFYFKFRIFKERKSNEANPSMFSIEFPFKYSYLRQGKDICLIFGITCKYVPHLIFSDFTPKVSISCRVPLLTISSKRRTVISQSSSSTRALKGFYSVNLKIWF